MFMQICRFWKVRHMPSGASSWGLWPARLRPFRCTLPALG